MNGIHNLQNIYFQVRKQIFIYPPRIHLQKKNSLTFVSFLKPFVQLSSLKSFLMNNRKDFQFRVFHRV